MLGMGAFTAPATAGEAATLLAAAFVLDFLATDFVELAAAAGGLPLTSDFSSDETFFLVILISWKFCPVDFQASRCPERSCFYL